MANINLVPEVKKEQLRLKQTNLAVTTTAVVVGGVLLATILLLGSLLGYRKSMISVNEKKINKITEELKPYKDLEESVLTLESGLAEIKGILTGGRDWTAFYGNIEKATPADVRFTNLKVSGSSIIAEMSGHDVKSVDRFIRSFSEYKDSDGKNVYSNVIVDGYTAKDDGTVNFQAKFNVVEASK